MEKIKTQLDSIRVTIKEHICNTLTGIFKHFNNGNLPNYEEDEEVLVEASQMALHLFVDMEVGNTYNSDTNIEKWEINDYVVTLDNNLFFRVCGDNEIEWKEIPTDDLFNIASKLNEVLNNL